MQPARMKPHAKEHTNNPVQKPNFRGHAGTIWLELESTNPLQSSRTTRGERTRELVSTWPGAKVDLDRVEIRNKPRAPQKTSPVQLPKILEPILPNPTP